MCANPMRISAKLFNSSEAKKNMETILITGGTGLVGTYLCRKLQDQGYKVVVLSRTQSEIPGITTYSWDFDKDETAKFAVQNAAYIIHLAGANIGDKRWTAKRKKIIRDSRIKTSHMIFDKIHEGKLKLRAFITASAVGYYGTISSEKIFSETDPPNPDFLGETCRQWEQAADRFESLGIRTVKIRTGVVLTSRGGALEKILMPVKFGIGSAIGSGSQFIPWIHIDDLCAIYIKALEDVSMRGAYNAAAPMHISNRDFTATLARKVKKPFWALSIPAAVIKIMFGQRSDVLLHGSRVSSQKIMETGYRFMFPDLKTALEDLLK